MPLLWENPCFISSWLWLPLPCWWTQGSLLSKRGQASESLACPVLQDINADGLMGIGEVPHHCMPGIPANADLLAQFCIDKLLGLLPGWALWGRGTGLQLLLPSLFHPRLLPIASTLLFRAHASITRTLHSGEQDCLLFGCRILIGQLVLYCREEATW